MSPPPTSDQPAPSMVAAIDIADIGVRRSARLLSRRPLAPSDAAGLRWGGTATLLPLASRRPPRLTRTALISFWDDLAAVDAFRENHPLAGAFKPGLQLTLRPLRAFGAWPGLPADVPRSRKTDHDGPVVVATLGRLRPSQLVRFIRASRPAERAALNSQGLIWGTAAARPPFVATISIWRAGEDAAAYAYGDERQPHPQAIAAQRRKDFHRQSAFVRFALIASDGQLEGDNPLPAGLPTP